jgi:spermidine synthase
LTLVLGTTALIASVASAIAGGPLLHYLLERLAVPPQTVGEVVFRHTSIVMALVGPIALGLGIAFPFTLAFATGDGRVAARRLGVMYATNTFGAVLGALLTGFAIISFFGLERTLAFASLILILGAIILAFRATSRRAVGLAAIVPASALCISAIVRPTWDRALMGSGAYMYGRVIPAGLDPETALRAGTSLYYREGASSTVSVKRLTGDLSLAIDGKVDASTSGDMLTQKTLAHLPLLLHPHPRDVAIVGLGSGVTLASALVHPVASADVIEISPEVIEASAFFNEVNRSALADPRTRLITGDGRSHLSLTSRQYDVIISEPSNPWMAGVAALFTREFFVTARSRLAPGGMFCQWTHTYAISETDLRSIVGTFASVFPNGTMWLVGTGDLLLIGSDTEISLDNLATGWRRPGVASDLGGVSASTPFSLLSLYSGGANELRRMQEGAALQTDDRMGLEFSGPLALYGDVRTDNAAMLRGLLPPERRPAPVARAYAQATAADWRGRAAMLMKADAYSAAYQDYVMSLTLSPTNAESLAQFVRSAVAARREVEATAQLKSWLAMHPQSVVLWTTLSKLYAVQGALADAVTAATVASRIEPPEAEALEQLASVYADAGNGEGLEPVVGALQRLYPERPRTAYFAASFNFLTGRMTDALELVKKSIDQDPLAAPAHNMLGAIHASMDHRHEARIAFQTALGLDPRDPAVYVNLALLELSAGRHDQAANLFAEALSLDPRSTAARQGLAQANARRVS